MVNTPSIAWQASLPFNTPVLRLKYTGILCARSINKYVYHHQALCQLCIEVNRWPVTHPPDVDRHRGHRNYCSGLSRLLWKKERVWLQRRATITLLKSRFMETKSTPNIFPEISRALSQALDDKVSPRTSKVRHRQWTEHYEAVLSFHIKEGPLHASAIRHPASVYTQPMISLFPFKFPEIVYR